MLKHSEVCKTSAVQLVEYKYLSCVTGVGGKIHPEGVVQHRW